MKREDSGVTRKEVVRAYKGRYAAPIKDGTRSEATLKALTDALYRRNKKRREEQQQSEQNR